MLHVEDQHLFCVVRIVMTFFGFIKLKSEPGDLARNTELNVQMSALGRRRRPSTRRSRVVRTPKACARGARGGCPPSPGGELGGFLQENFKNTGIPGTF